MDRTAARVEENGNIPNFTERSVADDEVQPLGQLENQLESAAANSGSSTDGSTPAEVTTNSATAQNSGSKSSTPSRLNIRTQLADLRLQKELLESQLSRFKARVADLANGRPQRANSDTQFFTTGPPFPGRLYPDLSQNTSEELNGNDPLAQTSSTPLVVSQCLVQPTAVLPSASTPVLTSFFKRPIQDGRAVTTSSSHSILFFRPPPFALAETESSDSIKNSDTGSNLTQAVVSQEITTEKVVQVTDKGKPSCHTFLQEFSPSLPPDGLWRHSSIVVDPDTGLRRVRRRVTVSTQVEMVNFWENPQMPRFAHLRHSHPNIVASSPWIYDEAALDALNHMTSTSTISQGQESNTSEAQINPETPSVNGTTPIDSHTTSTEGLISSSTNFGVQEEDLTEYMLQPMPSLVLDYVHPDTGAPEHPFPAPNEGRSPALGAVMAYINTPTQNDNRSRSRQRSSHVRRRNVFTSASSEQQHSRSSGFMSALRSELFHNILTSSRDGLDEDDLGLVTDASEDDLMNPAGEVDLAREVLVDVDANDPDSSDGASGSSASPGNSDSSLSTGSSSLDDEDEDDDDDDDDADDDDEESEDLNLGDGDADNISEISIGSSHTSLASDPGSGGAPSWFMPSTIGGGKYDYFRVTQRPRPFKGHKFVVSEFGVQARQNRSSLPWVPTRADRLRYILNEYIQQNVQMQNMETQTEDLEDENQNDGWIRLPAEANTSTKSCLKDGKVNKVVSWSIDLDTIQRPESDENDVNANTSNISQGDFDRSILCSRSCPGIMMSGDREGFEGDQGVVTLGLAELGPVEQYAAAKVPHDSEPIHVDVIKSEEQKPTAAIKKRRRMLQVFFGRCCYTGNSDRDIGKRAIS